MSSQMFEDGRWPGHTGNWGRWNDDRGTLNTIDPSVVLRAVSTVREGVAISCSRPVSDHEPLRSGGEKPFKHEMLTAGVWDLEPERTESLNASDRISVRTHGMVNTHIDALAHVGYMGKGFNGRPFDDMVTMSEGVKHGDVVSAVGTVTRGLLIDVAAARGVDHIEPGDCARPEDIEPHLSIIEPGDAVLIRVGGTLIGGRAPVAGENRHGTWPGLHPECVEMLATRDVSLLGSDTGNDVFPSPYEHICRSPVHTLALVYYGIHLIHNLDLEKLAKELLRHSRTHFLFVVSPLHLVGATGSVVAPVAVI
ncbi:cyclase family protein [Pseudaminobacter arsenicus]|uniref:Cyclase family protein n=1 Tax=Borborobacter arsenicus TaxID=1851146 RepID=A0A432V812_9HYPH|nr:cyclase family protein [Pseudaminobacter arsenicus]RUM98270.1 cyclase family protein [Pseudaminobacter arsenicus]